MSSIFAVLLPRSDSAWVRQVDELVSSSKSRGSDGTRTILMRSGPSENEAFRKLGTGDKLYGPTNAERQLIEYHALIGCAYSRPIALDKADAGPFHGNSIAIAYDGIVSAFSGDQLVEWLESQNVALNWDKIVSTIGGQYAIVMIHRNYPGRIYYAVKAKPLYVLQDSLGRGTIVSSSLSSLSGMYHPVRNSSPQVLEPYTTGFISLEGQVRESRSLIEYPGEGTLMLCGGGLDSLVASYDLKNRYPTERMKLLYFDYDAKAAAQELIALEDISGGLKLRYPDSETSFEAFRFPLLGQIASSTLTDWSLPVSTTPQAGRASEWLPARNTVLMSLGIAYAESHGYARIGVGINQDAAAAYPDNDGEWLERFQQLIPYAVGNGRSIRLVAPLAMMSKIDIVRHGNGLKIPWNEVPSWSCYQGGMLHCGECSSCRARRKAFQLARITDSTKYNV